MGYVGFHKVMARPQEGWWIRYLESWWPKGLNVASSGGISKIGMRREWNAYRARYSEEMERRYQQGRAVWAKEVEGIVGVMQRDGLSAGLEVLNELSRERCRELLQYMYEDGGAGGR